MQDETIQSLGGKARAEALSAERRSSISKKAADARWGLPKAICGAAEKPLQIGNIEIPCFVLEGEKRVLVQNGMLGALGLSHGGSGSKGGDRLAKFTHGDRIKSFIESNILDRTNAPILFRTPTGNIAYGYEAEVLAKICFAVLDAEKAGKLQKQQRHIAKQAEILVRGFAIVGINALVDEATGYQEVRAKNALAKILEQYVAKELRPWAPTFPLEFYRQIFRLKKWPFDPASVKRPSVIGHYTNDFIYSRLAPGILAELRKKNPRVETGKRKHKHFQWLTGEIGEPKLLAHFEGVMSLMKISDEWHEFKARLRKVYPKIETTELGLTVALKEKE